MPLNYRLTMIRSTSLWGTVFCICSSRRILQELRRVLHPLGRVFMEPHEGGTHAAVRARFGLEEETKRFTLQTLRFWTSMVTGGGVHGRRALAE